MDILLTLFLITVGFNLALFIPAYLYKTDRLTDVSYALSFVILSVFAYAKSSHNAAHTVLLLAVLLWAARLGGFLLMRIWNMKRDKRFDGMRENFFAFLRFWLLQGISVFIILLASLLYWRHPHAVVSTLSVVGVLIFGVGLCLETVADAQKFTFNQDPKNKGKWIDSGVWSKSRHPNYLGEMLVWIGLYIYGLTVFEGKEWLIGLASPLFIMTLLLFVSGIPLLEKSADERWGKDKAYQAYKKRVPKLLPVFFWRRATK